MSVPAFTASHGGRFISSGHGRHPTREITSWELILVIKGTLQLFVEERQLTAVPGECFLIPPHVLYGGHGAYSRNLSFFWIHFHPVNEAAQTLLKRHPQVFPIQNVSRLSEYFQLFLSLQDERPRDREALDMVVGLLVHEMGKSSAIVDENTELPPVLLRLRTLMKLRFRERISTRGLAAELQYNPDYLEALYLKHVGMSITDTLNDIRVQHAAKLLSDTTLTVSQIADQSGFNDPAYFRRRFFRRYAMTPHVYRRLKKEGYVNTE